jgi:hypothetical protein
MCKAVTALSLGKEYRQDEALDWGFLTREERHQRLARQGAAELSATETLTAETAASEPATGGAVE